MNRDGLLGRPRVGERLLPVEIAALDKRSEPPPKRTMKPASKAGRVNVQASGDGVRGPGQRLARCGGCKRVQEEHVYLA